MFALLLSMLSFFHRITPKLFNSCVNTFAKHIIEMMTSGSSKSYCRVLVLSYREFTCSFTRLYVFISVLRSLAPTTKLNSNSPKCGIKPKYIDRKTREINTRGQKGCHEPQTVIENIIIKIIINTILKPIQNN